MRPSATDLKVDVDIWALTSYNASVVGEQDALPLCIACVRVSHVFVYRMCPCHHSVCVRVICVMRVKRAPQSKACVACIKRSVRLRDKATPHVMLLVMRVTRAPQSEACKKRVLPSEACASE